MAGPFGGVATDVLSGPASAAESIGGGAANTAWEITALADKKSVAPQTNADANSGGPLGGGSGLSLGLLAIGAVALVVMS